MLVTWAIAVHRPILYSLIDIVQYEYVKKDIMVRIHRNMLSLAIRSDNYLSLRSYKSNYKLSLSLPKSKFQEDRYRPIYGYGCWNWFSRVVCRLSNWNWYVADTDQSQRAMRFAPGRQNNGACRVFENWQNAAFEAADLLLPWIDSSQFNCVWKRNLFVNMWMLKLECCHFFVWRNLVLFPGGVDQFPSETFIPVSSLCIV